LLRADANRCPDDGAVADTVWTLPKDTRLGAYRIDRMLGEGGMGFVYEATHEVLNRRSVIKMLRSELASQAHIVARFLNEAKAANTETIAALATDDPDLCIRMTAEAVFLGL
jgi:serine/threonine protein kinase